MAVWVCTAVPCVQKGLLLPPPSRHDLQDEQEWQRTSVLDTSACGAGREPARPEAARQPKVGRLQTPALGKSAGKPAPFDFHLQMSRNDFSHLPLVINRWQSTPYKQMSLPQFSTSAIGHFRDVASQFLGRAEEAYQYLTLRVGLASCSPAGGSFKRVVTMETAWWPSSRARPAGS